MNLLSCASVLFAVAVIGCSSDTQSSFGSTHPVASTGAQGGSSGGSSTGGTGTTGGTHSTAGGAPGSGAAVGAGGSGVQCRTNSDCPAFGCFMCGSYCDNGRCIMTVGGGTGGAGSGGTGGTNAGGTTGGASGTGASAGNGGSDAGSSRLCGSDPCTPTRCAGIGCGPAVCCHGPNGPVCIHGASECPAPDGGVRTETLACWNRSASSSFAKSCIADRDCFVATHYSGCCRIDALGLNTVEQPAFSTFETQCGTPTCGCCCDTTTAEDGKVVAAGNAATVACVSGVCTTKAP